MFQFTARPTAGNSVLLFVSLLLGSACSNQAPRSVAAGGGHTHVGGDPDPIAVTVFTERAELFMEYPRFEPDHEGRFLAHVTVLATGEPVRSGSMRLELTTPSGAARVLEAAQPARDGLFIPVGSFDAPGEYAARIVVTSEQLNDTFLLEPIVVYKDRASAFAAAEAEAEDDPPNTVPFLLEQAWPIKMLMQQVELQTLTQRLQVPGEVEAPTHAMAVASAPLAGLLLAPDSGALPELGEVVEAGQVLGYIEPPLSTGDAAQLVANEMSRSSLEIELLLREFDARAKTLEIDQALAQSSTQLEFASAALQRIQALREKDLGTIAELEAARRDLTLAQSANEGASALRDAFTIALEQLESLRANATLTRIETDSTGRSRLALLAPISGEIIAAGHVIGEHVESQAEVFRVLDSREVWISASVSEFDLARIGETPGALLEFAAYPGRTFDLMNELEGRLVNFGRSVDPETRTVDLRFAASNPQGELRTGMFVDVALETQSAIDCIAIPQESVVMDNGRPVAFVLLHGEAYIKRTLELGIRDGDMVQVLSGIDAGERVVTSGAYLIKLASANPAAFGAGHAH